MAKIGMTDMISVFHLFSLLFLLLSVLFLLIDIDLFIRLDIPKLTGYLTGRTEKKTVEQMRSKSLLHEKVK